MSFKNYRKTAVQPMRPYVPGEDLSGVSVSPTDTPREGGMIAMNPDNPADLWYVAPEFFAQNYVPDTPGKTLHNSDVSGARQNVPDIRVVGNGDAFQLLFKASSQAEGWMKSTKAMFVGNGCVVQVTTQQRNPDGSYALAEALSFVPEAIIVDDENGGRRLAWPYHEAAGELMANLSTPPVQ